MKDEIDLSNCKEFKEVKGYILKINQKETIKKLYEKKFSAQEISDMLNISIDEIKKIINEE